MCCALEVHLLAAPYVPSCANISLYSPPCLLDPIAISIIQSWLISINLVWALKKALGFFRLPQGDSETASGAWSKWQIQTALRSSGRLETLKPQAGWRPMVGPGTPLFCLSFFFWWKFFLSILGSCGHRKKLRRNKRTSEIFRWWLFQYGSLDWGKMQLNDTLME